MIVHVCPVLYLCKYCTVSKKVNVMFEKNTKKSFFLERFLGNLKIFTNQNWFENCPAEAIVLVKCVTALEDAILYKYSWSGLK